MIYEVYSVKDELANRFKYPMFYASKEEAQREFKSQVNNTQLWKDNPGDFSLYRLCSYNDETGEYTGSKELVCNGRAVLND